MLHPMKASSSWAGAAATSSGSRSRGEEPNEVSIPLTCFHLRCLLLPLHIPSFQPNSTKFVVFFEIQKLIGPNSPRLKFN